MGADMELVRQFNSEMASIYESKPPISKAKMASITRFAVKALKYYKHIVHSVEKFLYKCHADYKLPGLYVLDSIIRQSRHQFGQEKDLFGPRFQKNITVLFQYIYQCPQEEKPKVVRVLNLWQRNGIYHPEIISPLVDMASVPSKVLAVSIHKHKKSKSSHKPDFDDSLTFEQSNSFMDDVPLPLPIEQPEKRERKDREKVQVSQDDEIQVLKAQLEQQRKQQELLQQQLQMQIMATKQQSLQLQLQQQQMQNKIQEQMQLNTIDALKSTGAEQPVISVPQSNSQIQLLNQIQELTQQLEKDKATLARITNAEAAPVTTPINPPQVNTAENHSQFLENFQQLIQSAKGIILKDPRQQNNNGEEKSSHEGPKSPKFDQALLNAFEYEDEENVTDEQRIEEQKRRLEEEENKLKSRHETDQNSDDFQKKNRREFPFMKHGSENEGQPPFKKPLVLSPEDINHQVPQHSMEQNSQDDDAMQIDNDDEYTEDDLYQPVEESVPEKGLQPPALVPWPADLNRSEDRNVVEEEQERNKRVVRELEEAWEKEKSVMPPSIMNRLTVASTTLWIGRLPRGTHPGILENFFGEHGEIRNIDLIEARGCAFVTMQTRWEADRALRYLRNRRIDGAEVKMAWGQPKSLQEFAKFWDESHGCSYIPWGLFKPFHLRFFMEGCIVDKDTLPSDVRRDEGLHEEPTNKENQMPLTMPEFNSGMPGMPPGMPHHGLPPHGLPHGMPPPGMLPPPPPPMMPPGFRGQLPPLPMPGILPMSVRPPMPPVGILPLPGNVPANGGMQPSIQGTIHPNNQILPKPNLMQDQRIQQPDVREGRSLLPGPLPMPRVPHINNIRGPLFARPEEPQLPGRPRFDSVKNITEYPPTLSENRHDSIDVPKSSVEAMRAPPPPPILNLPWPSSDSRERKEPAEKKLHVDVYSRHSNSDITEHSKGDKMGEKSDQNLIDEHNVENSRNRLFEKNKDDHERKSRDNENRDSERKEKKERYSSDSRRDDRSDRRDRERDDRRERDFRSDRSRRGRDDRSERDHRNRDERESRRGERSSRDKLSKDGKDEFGRDEFNRDDDRGRRSEYSRDDDRSRRRDRSPEKNRYRDSDTTKERSRDTFKADEKSSVDKKEFPLDIKGQGLAGFKSTMQPLGEPISSASTSQSSIRKNVGPATGVRNAKEKSNARQFIPFSIFPFPSQSDDDDDDDDDDDNDNKKEEGNNLKNEILPVKPLSSKVEIRDSIEDIGQSSDKKEGEKKSMNRSFVPFSIFPLPSQSSDDEGSSKIRDNNFKDEVSSSPVKLSPSKMEVHNSKLVEESASEKEDATEEKSTKAVQEGELYDPLEMALSPEDPHENESVEKTGGDYSAAVSLCASETSELAANTCTLVSDSSDSKSSPLKSESDSLIAAENECYTDDSTLAVDADTPTEQSVSTVLGSLIDNTSSVVSASDDRGVGEGEDNTGTSDVIEAGDIDILTSPSISNTLDTSDSNTGKEEEYVASSMDISADNREMGKDSIVISSDKDILCSADDPTNVPDSFKNHDSDTLVEEEIKESNENSLNSHTRHNSPLAKNITSLESDITSLESEACYLGKVPDCGANDKLLKGDQPPTDIFENKLDSNNRSEKVSGKPQDKLAGEVSNDCQEQEDHLQMGSEKNAGMDGE